MSLPLRRKELLRRKRSTATERLLELRKRTASLWHHPARSDNRPVTAAKAKANPTCASLICRSGQALDWTGYLVSS